MIRKKYGVVGIMEWQTVIKLGKASLHVSFSGGAMTAFGITPAHYTTSNPMIQHAIENSEHFKRGKIQLLSEYEEEPKQTLAKKTELRSVSVNCVEDARDYLVEEFGATKNSLRNKKAIEDYASSKGIKFEGI